MLRRPRHARARAAVCGIDLSWTDLTRGIDRARSGRRPRCAIARRRTPGACQWDGYGVTAGAGPHPIVRGGCGPQPGVDEPCGQRPRPGTCRGPATGSGVSRRSPRGRPAGPRPDPLRRRGRRGLRAPARRSRTPAPASSPGPGSDADSGLGGEQLVRRRRRRAAWRRPQHDLDGQVGQRSAAQREEGHTTPPAAPAPRRPDLRDRPHRDEVARLRAPPDDDVAPRHPGERHDRHEHQRGLHRDRPARSTTRRPARRRAPRRRPAAGPARRHRPRPRAGRRSIPRWRPPSPRRAAAPPPAAADRSGHRTPARRQPRPVGGEHGRPSGGADREQHRQPRQERRAGEPRGRPARRRAAIMTSTSTTNTA